MVKGDESVEGWFAPEGGILRWSLLMPGGDTILSMMVGAESERDLSEGDIFLRVLFKPDQGSFSLLPEQVYSSGPYLQDDLLNSFVPVNIPLGKKWSQVRGELSLIVEGNAATDPGIKVLWGQPWIHSPAYRRHKNVLLIGVDTLRSDTCSPYGGRLEITPELQEFADSATVFEHAWAQAPWTLPSFASMITGGFPAQIGGTGYNERLPEFADTIGEIARSRGLTTMTICSNPWLGNTNSGFHQGMDTLWYKRGARAHVSVARAKAFMDENRDRDWLCFLHFMDPHTPYEPIQEYIDQFTDPSNQGPYQQSFADSDLWESGDIIPDQADIDQVRALYEGEVAFMDKYIGELFDWMDTNGLMEDTLIIFAADHGEEFYDHGQFGHGQSQYEELVRMPLIISGPGFGQGAKTDTPVSNLDIVPTIIEYIAPMNGYDLPGIPLQNVVTGSHSEQRIIFGEESGENSIKYAIQWPFKCIIDFVTGERKLFDLESDPSETTDISSDHPDLVEELKDEMIVNLLPRQPLFIIGIVGDPDNDPVRFTGTLEIPGGFSVIRDYAFQDGDTYTVNGNTIELDISGTINDDRKSKVMVIYPSEGATDLSASIMANYELPMDRFFPYGSDRAEPSGEITISLNEFPWPADLPDNYQDDKTAMYLLAFPGFDPSVLDQVPDEMDQETREQLEALGSLN